MQINELFNLYLQDLSRREVKTIQQIVRLYERNLKKDLGAKKVNKIVRGEIAETHFKNSDRAKTTANKCLGLLKAMFNLAITLENNTALKSITTELKKFISSINNDQEDNKIISVNKSKIITE